jgi:hypothetical protein
MLLRLFLYCTHRIVRMHRAARPLSPFATRALPVAHPVQHWPQSHHTLTPTSRCNGIIPHYCITSSRSDAAVHKCPFQSPHSVNRNTQHILCGYTLICFRVLVCTCVLINVSRNNSMRLRLEERIAKRTYDYS